MALLQKLKELLGIGGGDDRTERGDTEVTVERDPEPESEPPGEAGEDEETGDEPIGEAPGDDEEPAEETDNGGEEDGEGELGEDDGDADETTGEGNAEEPDDDGEPVQNIKGIGPAYADRLEGIGIHTVAQLAAADPGAVAEGAKIGEGRASTWIDRANERQ